MSNDSNQLQWQCEHCTLLQSSSNIQCELCHHSRSSHISHVIGDNIINQLKFMGYNNQQCNLAKRLIGDNHSNIDIETIIELLSTDNNPIATDNEQHQLSSNSSAIWQLSSSHREKVINLLLTILTNLKKHSDNISKYGNLNYKKISHKLQNCTPALNLLFLSGFQPSNDQQRLIWIDNNHNSIWLNNVYLSLQKLK
eukprot:367896_1